MSEVKRYDLVGGMDGNCNLNEARMELSDDGVYVKHRDYEALQAKCAAMAAENAGMSVRTPVAYSYRYAGCETCEGFQDWRWELSKEKPPEWMLETGKVTNLVELFELHETPATDAFLAEIKRKAIRKFINSIEHILRDKLSPYDTEEMLEAMRIFLEEQEGEQK